MKCKKCYMDIEWKKAFVTVDGVKYKSYTCKECHTVVQGEKIENESS